MLVSIWQNEKPYWKNQDGSVRCYLVNSIDASELGVSGNCVTLCQANDGEIYVQE